jgi:hypothetical protein
LEVAAPTDTVVRPPNTARSQLGANRYLAVAGCPSAWMGAVGMESAAKGLRSVIAAHSTGIVVVQMRTVWLRKVVRLSLALAGRNESLGWLRD